MPYYSSEALMFIQHHINDSYCLLTVLYIHRINCRYIKRNNHAFVIVRVLRQFGSPEPSRQAQKAQYRFTVTHLISESMCTQWI